MHKGKVLLSEPEVSVYCKHMHCFKNANQVNQMKFPGLGERDYTRNIAKCETYKKRGKFNLQIN